MRKWLSLGKNLALHDQAVLSSDEEKLHDFFLILS